MAEEKGKKNPNQKRHMKKPVVKVELTPEQIAAQKAATLKAQAEAKAEAERFDLWQKEVPKMTTAQIKGEVRRLLKREHVKVGKDQYEPLPGLTIAFATVFSTVLDSTKTLYNRDDKPERNRAVLANLSCYVR